MSRAVRLCDPLFLHSINFLVSHLQWPQIRVYSSKLHLLVLVLPVHVILSQLCQSPSRLSMSCIPTQIVFCHTQNICRRTQTRKRCLPIPILATH